MLKSWLAHPATRGLDIDSPTTTSLRKAIIQENGFLLRLYQEWYTFLASVLPASPGRILELGSGAGFFKDFVPGLIKTEIFTCSHIDLVLDGCNLPFSDSALAGIAMTNVLHHISRPQQFLKEAARCVRPGGIMAMIEPWVSPWSKFVYTRLHHEPFDPQAQEWQFPSSGPVSGANSALPWIIFERDRPRFELEFPEWQIRSLNPCLPFRYLVSGGVSRRALMPAWSFPFWRDLEKALSPWMKHLAMFAWIVMVRAKND